MKNLTANFAILFSVLLLASCLDKNPGKNAAAENTDSSQAESPEAVAESETKVYAPYFEEKEDSYSTLADVSVNSEGVDVYLMPNLYSEVISSVTKGDIVNVIGMAFDENYPEKYWAKIRLSSYPKDLYCGSMGPFGFVDIKKLDLPQGLTPGVVSFSEYVPGEEHHSGHINIEVDRGGKKEVFACYPSKLDGQDFATFVWADDKHGFFYTDMSGTFSWNSQTNEIKHLTYMGSDSESAWSAVSDDNKKFFEDYGTGPGSRCLKIYDMLTNRMIYSGSHLRGLDYHDNAITVVYDLRSWKALDEAVKEKNLPSTDDFFAKLSAEGIELKDYCPVLRYRLNLDTLEESFLDYTVVFDQ